MMLIFLTPTSAYFGDSTELIYLRSRIYDPAFGRFTTKDSWQGDYSQPLSLNHWVYVGNDPINRADPSGLWYCTGAPKCREWIQKALDILRNITPDGKQIYDEFENADQKVMIAEALSQVASSDPVDIVNGSCDAVTSLGFGFVIKPLYFGMQTMPWGFYIKDDYLSRPPDGYAAAKLGHEFLHRFRQPFSLATTIQGEVFAAQFEATLALEQNLHVPSEFILPGYDRNMGVLSMNPYYGPDLMAWRNHGYPWWEPLAPQNVSLIWPVTPSPDCVQSYPNQPPICVVPTAPSTAPVTTSTPQP